MKLRFTDLVNRETEIHRKESVKVKEGKLRVDDETFGTLLIVRADKNLVWRADLLAGTWSELSLDVIPKHRKAFLEQVREWRGRVEGTDDAKDLDRILRGFQDFEITSADVKPTGKQANILGRNVAEQQLLINGNIENGNIEGFRFFVDESFPQGRYYFEMLSKVSCFGERVAEAVRSVRGLPVKGVMRVAWFLDRVVSDEEVLSIQAIDLDDGEFELPKGLKRIAWEGIDEPRRWKVPKPSSFKKNYSEDEIERQQNPFQSKQPSK